MPSIANVGGSITSAVALTLLAWAVRFIRSAHNKRVRGARRPLESTSADSRRSRFFSRLSAAAIRQLVETSAFPHCLFALHKDGNSAPEETPDCLSRAVRLPAQQVLSVLVGGPISWSKYGPTSGTPWPNLQSLLVFMSGNEAEMEEAADAAAASGYEHVAVLQGSLSDFAQPVDNQSRPEVIHRDALTVLMQQQCTASSAAGPWVRLLDVRRSDERILFGSIQGSCHLPVQQVVSALNWSPAVFEAAYHFSKPSKEDVLIFHSRTNTRAAWAAQAARDAGFRDSLVHEEGVCGWRLDRNSWSCLVFAFSPPDMPPAIDSQSANAKFLPRLAAGDFLRQNARRTYSLHEGFMMSMRSIDWYLVQSPGASVEGDPQTFPGPENASAAAVRAQVTERANLPPTSTVLIHIARRWRDLRDLTSLPNGDLMLKIVDQPAGQGSRQGPSSEALVDGMWQLAAPSLPKTHQQVEEWLFNQSGPQIPVTYRHYQQAKAKRPDAAQHFLTEGGDAEVAVAFTACLAREPPAQLTSESHTAGLVQHFLFTAFEGLKSYSRDRLQYSIRLNESEKDRSHPSRSHKEKVRPDTMVIVSSCTLLLGEDKHANLAAAFQDLLSKRVDLSSRHYKDVTFLLAYAAAQTSFQWFFLPQLADQAPITLGHPLDMATELGRYELLRTCIQAYRLLFVMNVNLADLPTRLAPYVILDRGDGRSLEWTKEGICKKIPDGQQPCLIGSIHPPRLLKQGYKVITSPQGFPPMVLSEEDLHAIALASCEAARILHTKGLVHRDLRFANIIELARRQYVVIDLESVAEVSNAALPGNFEQVKTAGCGKSHQRSGTSGVGSIFG
ncbi:hypothetical protein WJX74_004567 [Apatococcus lobatus]|uniref:Rhodanese domain-containing protein n=1 Tax=Apatococcus lobatus TaxID=904363 RepID=A0AAW1R3E6_9CHLO